MTLDIRLALARALESGGSGDALAWQGHWSSWSRLHDMRLSLDALLESCGLRDAPAGLVARNRPGCVAALVGQIASGRTTVMIHGAQSAAGIAADMIRADVAVVIAEEEDWSAEARASADQAGVLAIALHGVERMPHILAGGDAVRTNALQRNPDIGVELLSSGTTGPPKRVPLLWATLSSAAHDAQAAYAGTGARTAAQILLHPLGNIAGIAYLVPAYAARQPIVLLERFTVESWVEAVHRHRPVRVSLPVAALRMLLDSDISARMLESLEVVAVGGGKLDIDIQDRFEARFGIPVLTAFGATEFAGVIANWSLDLYRHYGVNKRGSAGRASANVSLRIVDPDGNLPLPAGAVGLLEAKVARLGDGWIRTTDLASIDADGFLFVHGRADGAIDRGGFKIVPETVSAALTTHPAVADAAVVARPDRRLGAVPVAAVELKPGMTVTGAALRAYLKDRLLAYQVPVDIRVVDSLPRTGSMKVALAEVAALFQ